jgi:hypothetical protein
MPVLPQKINLHLIKSGCFVSTGWLVGWFVCFCGTEA